MNDLAFVVAALLAAGAVLALQGHHAGTRSRFDYPTLTGLSRLRKAELIDRLLSAAVPG
ncbi:MAG: hypothetical protein ACKO5M_03195 [Vulcanococcus sp.]